MYGFITADNLNNYLACKKVPTICSDVNASEDDWKCCEYPRIPEALVNLSDNSSPALFNPITGPATNATYWDEESLLGNRLFGQGTTMNLQKLVVLSKLCMV